MLPPSFNYSFLSVNVMHSKTKYILKNTKNAKLGIYSQFINGGTYANRVYRVILLRREPVHVCQDKIHTIGKGSEVMRA